MMKRRTQLSLPNNMFKNGGTNNERLGTLDNPKISFGLNDMGPYNKTSRNVDEYGGMPFVQNQGSNCFRGVNPHKKARVHPSQTAKRVIYNADGTGRDTYILKNNGGFSINNTSGIKGTDVNLVHQENLRHYNKEVVSFGPNTQGSYVTRVVDDFLNTNLKNEDPDYSLKLTKRRITNNQRILSFDQARPTAVS